MKVLPPYVATALVSSLLFALGSGGAVKNHVVFEQSTQSPPSPRVLTYNPVKFEDSVAQASEYNPVKFEDPPSQHVPNYSAIKYEDISPQETAYSGMKYEDTIQRSVGYKPMKFDSSGASSKPTVTVVHPYSYEDSAALPSFGSPSFADQRGFSGQAYVPQQQLNYVPPRMPQGNSKLDHLIADLQHYKHPPSPWRKLVRVLTAAIPIGLFLAALPPNVVQINATQSVKPLGTSQQRKRSEAEGDVAQSFPVLDLIERLGGLSALEHPGCEANIFCEMARLGATPGANAVQRTLWSMANETPEPIADLLGARELLKAVRTDACAIYECPEPSQRSADPPILQPVGEKP